jgi:hypothetical protein
MISAANFAAIAALDLDPVKVKLMHEESGEGWSRAYADAMAFEYRRFLYLVKKFPNEQVAPLFDVDVFWHYHILDTMKYAADCQAIFGYFLHHFPYVALGGAADLEAHERAGERMRDLYQQAFGQVYSGQQEPLFAAAQEKIAFCTPSAKDTLSLRTSRAAFSIPAQQVAFCTPSMQFAFSWPAAAPASIGAPPFKTANVAC